MISGDGRSPLCDSKSAGTDSTIRPMTIIVYLYLYHCWKMPPIIVSQLMDATNNGFKFSVLLPSSNFTEFPSYREYPVVVE